MNAVSMKTRQWRVEKGGGGSMVNGRGHVNTEGGKGGCMEMGCVKVGAVQKGDAKRGEGTRRVGTLQRRAMQKKAGREATWHLWRLTPIPRFPSTALLAQKRRLRAPPWFPCPPPPGAHPHWCAPPGLCFPSSWVAQALLWCKRCLLCVQ